ncbi:MAG: RsmB/NOP family class I SAM-dependent RNA methyltransferase [Holosporaceae bacterium]|jgi:16S rRNA (cytosine967-C5)-methyltransferase|nr:RsmB/NOP family class I SAM-dependent RNA methyltransferase [Holosporaceae bacterium]
MQLASHIQICITMLDIFIASSAPFDIIMAKFFKNHRVGSHDRRAIAEFVYSIFRNFEKIKFLSSNISSNFGRIYALIFLRICYTLSENEIDDIFSGKPFHPPKLTEFEKQILSAANKELDFPENVKLNYPQWMTPLFRRAFQQDAFVNEISALNEKAFVDLRVNTLKSTREEVKCMLRNSGFELEDCRYSPYGLRLLKGRIGRNHEVLANGLAEIQDEGSQLIAEACAASPGDVVVDYCAGAGGKTLALAAIMKNKGRIFALDKYEERLANAKVRFRKANVNNVFCQQISGKWIKRHRESADVVLVDVPCSGVGTWRWNPDMRAKYALSDLEELLNVQAEILESAFQLAKKGGKLVYATCSVLMEENEDQIAKFLENHPEFVHQKVNLSNYSGDYLRLTPFQHKTDGFFAAVLRKN